MSRYVAPAVIDAFNCPPSDCGALAHQTWLKVFVAPYKRGERPTTAISPGFLERVKADLSLNEDEKESAIFWCDTIIGGQIYPEQGSNADGTGRRVINLDLCRCFSCGQFSVWNRDKLIYPRFALPITPNADMNEELRSDFLEAVAILEVSPRGSAALLRLCVQKLCIQLGEKGRNINEDIGSLVKKGLDKRIQQALDVVRVIGNSAVHPGQIDWRDNTATARQLFNLVNVIADAMISQPKAIEALYHDLPAGHLKAIVDRDGQP